MTPAAATKYDHIRCGTCGVPHNEHDAEHCTHGRKPVESAAEPEVAQPHEPGGRIEDHGIECEAGRDYMYYRGVDIKGFRVPRDADWAKIRLCVDDAERRSKTL